MRLWGLGLALAGSIAFSGKAIIVKLAYRHGVDAVTLIMYRMLFALPLFVALAWWAGRGQAAARARDLRVIAGLGLCGYYLASFLDFAGLQYVSASLERLILYLNPTLVLFLGAVLFKHRVQRAQLLALAVSYGGVLLVFGHEARFTGSNTCWVERWSSAARSATRCTWCTAAPRCAAWARCGSPAGPLRWPRCCALRSSCCCGPCQRRWWRRR
jgi:drug/metabolite transporter (DMT)-like permease